MSTSASDIQVGGDHYKRHDLQPWDVMQAWFSADEFRGFLRGCALKYLARYRDKGGVQDIRKAIHYLEKLAEFEQADEMKRTTILRTWEGDT